MIRVWLATFFVKLLPNHLAYGPMHPIAKKHRLMETFNAIKQK